MAKTKSTPQSFQTSGTSPTLSPSSSLTISEYAEIFGFTSAAVIEAIHRNRRIIKKDFYNITELAERWSCSRATVYTILEESEFKSLNVASKTSKQRDSWRIPASAVEHIECRRSRALGSSEEAA